MHCVGCSRLAAAVSAAVAKHQITPTQGASARCKPALMMVVASTTTTTTTAAVPHAMIAAATLGTTVACTSATKFIRSTNALGMTLIWHATDGTWCWDRNFTITGGSWGQRDDSTGFCWGYDGETTPYYSGGTGWGFWDITRGGRFSCHASILAVFHRNLYGGLSMSGGGGSY